MRNSKNPKVAHILRLDIAFDIDNLRILIHSCNRYVKILKSVSLD